MNALSIDLCYLLTCVLKKYVSLSRMCKIISQGDNLCINASRQLGSVLCNSKLMKCIEIFIDSLYSEREKEITAHRFCFSCFMCQSS